MEQHEKRKTLWQRTKQFVQSSKTSLIVFLLKKLTADKEKENFYIGKIEEKIKRFRLMSENAQGKHLATYLFSIEEIFAEGRFDSKIQIKYSMHFIKAIKMKIFLPTRDNDNYTRMSLSYVQSIGHMEKFIGELHGVEESKEGNFLNTLSHEERVNLNNALRDMLGRFCTIVLNKQSFSKDNSKNFLTEIKKVFPSEENDIKRIVGATQQRIAEQEKIDKLKKASEIFKNKAEEHRCNSRMFLISAVALAAGIFLFVFSKEIFEYEFFEYGINFSQEYDANSNAFYIYFILEALLRGKLLFPVMVLTGFFYCLRFYAASNHNAIICDQRANTLESFEALYENVGKDNVGKDNVGKDNEGKKAGSKVEDREGNKERLLVVEKVLNSATEHLPTGFSKQQSDSGVGGIVSSLASLLKR